MRFRSNILFLVLSFLPPVQASAMFPNTVEISPEGRAEGEKIRLHKTGESERKILFLRIYWIAHYLELPYTEEVPVHESHSPRAVHLVFQRTISGKRIEKEFIELIQSRCNDSEWADLQESVYAYTRPFAEGNVRKGDRFTLEWIPPFKLVSFFNEDLISSIDNPRFARLLWSVWTGADSIVDAQALLGKYFR